MYTSEEFVEGGGRFVWWNDQVGLVVRVSETEGILFGNSEGELYPRSSYS